MASASDAQSRRCLVLCDCKPALQQIEGAHRKGMPEGLRDWERGGLLEAIVYYRSKLEAVVFMWVPARVGIACNAYADAVATAYPPHSQHNAFSVGFLSTQIVVSNGTLRGAQRVPRASSKHPGSRQSVLIRARHVL